MEKEMEPFHKKRRLDVPTAPGAVQRSPNAPLISLSRSISPPAEKSSRSVSRAGDKLTPQLSSPAEGVDPVDTVYNHETTIMPSPIKLTRIRDLNVSNNVDTIGLGDILGDPLIRECWQFNYLFDVDFLM